jgi:hypothetical protein
MIADRIKELGVAKAKMVALESQIMAERDSALAGLPSAYGFTSLPSFISAVRAATSNRRGRKFKSAKPTPPVGKARRKRAVITDAIRGKVKKFVEAGKTGREIANTLRISLPSVQNIKEGFGLVKRRDRKG